MPSPITFLDAIKHPSLNGSKRFYFLAENEIISPDSLGSYLPSGMSSLFIDIQDWRQSFYELNKSDLSEREIGLRDSTFTECFLSSKWLINQIREFNTTRFMLERRPLLVDDLLDNIRWIGHPDVQVYIDIKDRKTCLLSKWEDYPTDERFGSFTWIGNTEQMCQQSQKYYPRGDWARDFKRHTRVGNFAPNPTAKSFEQFIVDKLRDS